MFTRERADGGADSPNILLMGKPAAQLGPKHYKALELIEEGTLTYKEIAHQIGVSEKTLYHLIEGNLEKEGTIASLFESEVKKITLRSQSKVRQLTHDNKKLALLQLNDRLKHLKKKKKLDRDDSSELTKIINSLSKMTPTVEINSLSIHKGLTERDVLHEFQRLTALANAALKGIAVQSIVTGRSGTLSDTFGGTDETTES